MLAFCEAPVPCEVQLWVWLDGATETHAPQIIGGLAAEHLSVVAAGLQHSHMLLVSLCITPCEPSCCGVVWVWVWMWFAVV